ncbi:hypothetical protein SAMN02745164_00427 [Marinitoga hydrogenitolerans DSM 16785]|uniref:Uncharacterized protein n=1 Tax=Marinitoga hydrogenitolerans (strain DSM 16785 / JCM 12826 / AT1271) TaxID=1122195 RepID=A0A1M4TFV5_MARH1|nr:hypothetical protein [Marinitoga hydrogenitolerans]SHE43392.1 hypothetical protein SAMN02745164_00427 [Marinitoga hydrogenitolerans DSM 16785]
MIMGIISILIGILIFASLIFKVSFTISLIIELILSLIFIFNGMKIFKNFKSENLGYLIFGIILLFDMFNLFNFDASMGELILLFIGAQLLASGIDFFIRDFTQNHSKNTISKNEQFFELQENKQIKVSMDVDWNKCNITSHNENKIKINSKYNKSIFKQKINFTDNNFIFEEKLRINSINIPERAESFIYLPSKINAILNIHSNVSELVLDLYDINSNYTKVNAKASKLHLIPSSKIDSNIDINIQVSNLILEIPSNVFVIINFIGDLTLKELNNFTQKDDSTLVSNNFKTAKYTCKINISSEMSKISSFTS